MDFFFFQEIFIWNIKKKKSYILGLDVSFILRKKKKLIGFAIPAVYSAQSIKGINSYLFTISIILAGLDRVNTVNKRVFHILVSDKYPILIIVTGAY